MRAVLVFAIKLTHLPPNPLLLSLLLVPPAAPPGETLPGRDKSSVWDQLEDAAMETFSLSRADFMLLLSLLCQRVCFPYQLSLGLLFHLTALGNLGTFVPHRENPEHLSDRTSLICPSDLDLSM